jgi:hypothetical protein
VTLKLCGNALPSGGAWDIAQFEDYKRVMPCQAMSMVVVHVASGTRNILVFLGRMAEAMGHALQSGPRREDAPSGRVACEPCETLRTTRWVRGLGSEAFSLSGNLS